MKLDAKWLFDTLEVHDTIAIYRHVYADGDAMGAQFGLKALIEARWPQKRVYAPGKSDRALEDVILKMYEFSSSCPDPEAWLEDCCRAYRADSVEALEKTPFFAFVQEEVRLAAQTARQLAGRAEALCRQPETAPTCTRRRWRRT